jgi:hypothetical protein
MAVQMIATGALGARLTRQASACPASFLFSLFLTPTYTPTNTHTHTQVSAGWGACSDDGADDGGGGQDGLGLTSLSVHVRWVGARLTRLSVCMLVIVSSAADSWRAPSKTGMLPNCGIRCVRTRACVLQYMIFAGPLRSGIARVPHAAVRIDREGGRG